MIGLLWKTRRQAGIADTGQNCQSHGGEWVAYAGAKELVLSYLVYPSLAYLLDDYFNYVYMMIRKDLPVPFANTLLALGRYLRGEM